MNFFFQTGFFNLKENTFLAKDVTSKLHKSLLVILKMILESMLYLDMETSLTPILKRVFSLLVNKQINALHGKLHLTKFTMIKLRNRLFIKMLG